MNAYVSLSRMFSNSSFHNYYKCCRYMAKYAYLPKILGQDRRWAVDWRPGEVLFHFHQGRRHGPVMLGHRRRCRGRFSRQPLAPPGAACELCGAAEVKTREMRRVSTFDFELRWGYVRGPLWPAFGNFRIQFDILSQMYSKDIAP